MIIDVIVKFKDGLHAREALSLVKIARSCNSFVKITTQDGKVADCKSLISILAIDIKEKEKIQIKIDGRDEQEVSEKLIKLFN